MAEKKKAKFSVSVTAADIKRGVRRSVGYCPIALAVRRTVRRRYITVGGDELWWNREYLAPLPKRAKHFIWRFDSGELVKPVAFTLLLPRAFSRPQPTKRGR